MNGRRTTPYALHVANGGQPRKKKRKPKQPQMDAAYAERLDDLYRQLEFAMPWHRDNIQLEIDRMIQKHDAEYVAKCRPTKNSPLPKSEA